jgi:hypothetical protein
LFKILVIGESGVHTKQQESFLQLIRLENLPFCCVSLKTPSLRPL